MSPLQNTIALCVGIVSMIPYWVCAMKNGRKRRARDVLMFGLMGAGLVTGMGVVIDSVVASFAETKHGSLFVMSGLFGCAVALMSIQKAVGMVTAVMAAKEPAGAAPLGGTPGTGVVGGQEVGSAATPPHP